MGLFLFCVHADAARAGQCDEFSELAHGKKHRRTWLDDYHELAQPDRAPWMIRRLASLAPAAEKRKLNAVADQLEAEKTIRPVQDVEQLEQLHDLVHHVTWNEKYARRRTPYGRAIQRVRKEIFAVAARFPHGDLEAESSRVLGRMKLVASFDSPHFYDLQTTADVYLKLFLDPAFDESLRELALAEQHTSYIGEGDRFAATLNRFAKVIPNLPPPIAAALLENFAHRYLARAAETQRLPNGSRTEVEWHDRDVESLIHFFTTPERAAFRERLKSEFAHLPPQEAKFAAEPFVADVLFLHDHPLVRQLLTRVVQKQKYRALSAADRAVLFFYLSRATLDATTTPDAQHAKLLRQTVDVVLDDAVTLKLAELETNTLGDASHRSKVIRLNRRHAADPDDFANGDATAEMVDTLAHEVSHIQSRVPVSQRVEYFEEEMRAWLVGFYAGHGRLPTQRDAANRAWFLLHYRSEDSEDAYLQIAVGWEKNPETFTRHLKELGLAGLTPQSKLKRAAWIQATSDKVTAPLWGWDGFLTNEVRPESGP